MYILEMHQTVNAPVETVWNFVQSPANLNAITPEDLFFRIITDVPEQMFNGLLIEYQLQIPLFGKQRWITEIKHIEDQVGFVDEQRIGPFRFWYHQHILSARSTQQTDMTDRVCYCMPYGILGRLIHSLYVRKTLERIFNYRQHKLSMIFNERA